MSALVLHANDERKRKNEYFFKTGKGEYGFGDVFIGVSMPQIRTVAKNFSDLPLEQVKVLLYDKIHELRMLSLIILVNKFKKSETREKQKIVEFYLEHKSQINNWDLVDCSAHYILGQAVLDGLVPSSLLDELIASKIMWHRRIGMVATWIMIRNGDTGTILRLGQKLLNDPEDLMHKAVGWMLREAWKKSPEKIEKFIVDNYDKMPRTTLRYAIERFEQGKRKRFLRGEF